MDIAQFQKTTFFENKYDVDSTNAKQITIGDVYSFVSSHTQPITPLLF